MEKKLQELTDIELKALAYDHLAQLQLLQNNLNAINQELSKRVQNAQQGSQPVVSPTNSQIIPRLGTAETV